MAPPVSFLTREMGTAVQNRTTAVTIQQGRVSTPSPVAGTAWAYRGSAGFGVVTCKGATVLPVNDPHTEFRASLRADPS